MCLPSCSLATDIHVTMLWFKTGKICTVPPERKTQLHKEAEIHPVINNSVTVCFVVFSAVTLQMSVVWAMTHLFRTTCCFDHKGQSECGEETEAVFSSITSVSMCSVTTRQGFTLDGAAPVFRTLQIIFIWLYLSLLGRFSQQWFWGLLSSGRFLLRLLFNPEDGGDTFLRNVGQLSSDYMALYLKRQKAFKQNSLMTCFWHTQHFLRT
jgi:hypothetical protein